MYRRSTTMLRIVYLALTCQCRSSAEAADICHVGAGWSRPWLLRTSSFLIFTYPATPRFSFPQQSSSISQKWLIPLPKGALKAGIQSFLTEGYFGNSRPNEVTTYHFSSAVFLTNST